MMRLLALLLLLAGPVMAVQPDEILADSALEARARAISKDIRCPVCQGESIDDSNAPISRDLRIIIRERLTAGDTDEDVVRYVVDRYGEFVLFRPPVAGPNLILWLSGPALLLIGLSIAVATQRRRKAGPEDSLTAVEEARLKEILKD